MKGQQVLLAPQDRQESLGPLGPPETQDLLGQLAPRVPETQAQLVLPVRRGRLEIRGLRERQGHKGLQALKVPKVLKDLRAYRETMARPGLQVLPAQQGLQGRLQP